jgi:hypothetical protein
MIWIDVKKNIKSHIGFLSPVADDMEGQKFASLDFCIILISFKDSIKWGSRNDHKTENLEQCMRDGASSGLCGPSEKSD